MPEFSTGHHTFASKNEPNHSRIRLITTFSVSAYLKSGRHPNTLIELRGYWISAKHKKENPALWLGFVNERHELLAQSTPEMLVNPGHEQINELRIQRISDLFTRPFPRFLI